MVSYSPQARDNPRTTPCLFKRYFGSSPPCAFEGAQSCSPQHYSFRCFSFGTVSKLRLRFSPFLHDRHASRPMLLTSIAARATCDCGYSVNSTSALPNAVFTELLESDFLHLENISSNDGWIPQAYNVSAIAARGPLGKSASLANVAANPISNQFDWGGVGAKGGDPGLQLWARAVIEDGMIGMGEITTERRDVMYGSIRVGMKVSNITGTCAAFFWVSRPPHQTLASPFSDSMLDPVFRQYAGGGCGVSVERGNPKQLCQPHHPISGFSSRWIQRRGHTRLPCDVAAVCAG